MSAQVFNDREQRDEHVGAARSFLLGLLGAGPGAAAGGVAAGPGGRVAGGDQLRHAPAVHLRVPLRGGAKPPGPLDVAELGVAYLGGVVRGRCRRALGLVLPA